MTQLTAEGRRRATTSRPAVEPADMDRRPVPASLPATASAGHPRRWQVLAVLCTTLTIIAIDTTVLNVALPSIQRSLDPSAGQLQWIVDAYTIVFAGLLLTAGTIGDRFGRRGALIAGVVVFGAGSAAAALSTTPAQLIAWRAVTGIGASLMFPATLSILTNVFTDPKERQKAIAVWAGTAGIGIGLGPVVGGLLLRHYSWSSVFWVNLPVCALALVGMILVVPSAPGHRSGAIDARGAVLSIAGLSALVFAIIEGPEQGWTSAVVVGAAALAVVLLAAFVVTELRHRSPMLDVRLFRNPRFSAASMAVSAIYFALFGTIFLMTQHMQVVLGYDALGAGLRTLPYAAVLIIVANTTPKLVGRLGTGRVITVGLLFVALSQVLRFASTADTGYGPILASMVTFAFGMGLVIAPATASIMSSVPPERAGVGSAVNDTTRQVGGALGVAVMGSIASSVYRHGVDDRLRDTAVPVGSSARVDDSVASAFNAAHDLGGNGAVVLDAARHAFIDGVRAASVVAFVLLIGAAIASSRLLPSR
jgi:EmrB/QacA subfamily drug resistance transporter